MAAPFRFRNRVLAVKIQSAEGTAETPTVGSDAVLVSGPGMGQGLGLIDTGEVTSALDARQRITGGGPGTASMTVVLKGHGTAGTAPEYDPLLQACAMGVTALGGAVAGTAQAGTASTLQLAASDVSANGDFIGAVITTTGGTGSGQTRVITDSVASSDTVTVYPDWATTPDATTAYSIADGVTYQPASTSLKVATIYEWLMNTAGGNATLRQRFDCAGTFRITIPLRQLATIAFTMQGRIVADSDVTNPATPTYDAGVKVPFMGADCYLGGTAIAPRTVSLDYGATVSNSDDPSDTYGVGAAGVTARRISGQINPPRTTVSGRNVLAALIAGTEYPLWLRWGSVAGSRVSLYLPAIRYTGEADEDVDGFLNQGIPFDVGGVDTGMYLHVY